MANEAAKLANGEVLGKNEFKRAKLSTENQLYYLYIFVALIVSSSWVLGAFSFSFLWVFVLAAILFTVWKTQVTQLVRRHLQLEEVMVHRKRALRNTETSEWLNFLINRWWVFSSSTIEDLVKKRLDARLSTVKPSFISQIELFSFTVGEQTPHLKNVTVFEFDDGVPGGQKPINWLTVMQPPFGLHKMSSFRVVVEADMALHSNDFKMVFRSFVGVNKASIMVDSAVENLNITGRVQFIVNLSMDVPFPHISKASIFFIETPEVWFNVKTMKALQLMQIPLLKTWIYTHVMEGLTAALVDPGKIDLNMAKAGPVLSPRQKMAPKPLARGVLTVTLQGKPPKQSGDSGDVLYHVVRCHERKRNTQEVFASEEWESVCSFFVYDLAKDKISLKRKCKRLLTSVTLEEFELPLSKFPLEVKKNISTVLEGKDGSVITLLLKYDSLSKIDLNELLPKAEDGGHVNLPVEQPTAEVSGVMFVSIHAASNVLASDKGGASDPYCVLFCDRSRILTTPYESQTRNPKWESNVEFFVRNFSKMSLSFYVYDWDGTSMIDDDFLGSAHLSLSRNQPKVLKEVLTLGYNKPTEGHVENKSFGCITVSAVFRPVSAVAQSERYREYYEGWSNDNLYKEGEVRSNVQPSSIPHQHTQLPSRRPPLQSDDGAFHVQVPMEESRRQTAKEMAASVLEDKLLVELTFIQAKDLMGGDRNGMSDPYVELKKGKKKLYETSVKKKTLTPLWNENVTFILPNEKEQLELNVQDKDFIGKDFLGHLTLSVDQLKAMSIKGTPQWFQLERTKSGQIELKCSITSSDEKSFNNNNNNAANVQQVPQVSKTYQHAPVEQTTAYQVNAGRDNSLPRSYASSSDERGQNPASETDLSGHDSSFWSAGDSSMDATSSPKMRVPTVTLSDVDREPAVGRKKQPFVQPNGHRDGENFENKEKEGHLMTPESPAERRLIPGRSGIRMKRSVSDVNVSRNKEKKGFFTHRLRPAESRRSLKGNNSNQNRLHSFGGWDSMSTSSSVLATDKFYNVRGTLHFATGLGNLTGDIYCKIRVDNRRSHHRTKKLSPGKVVAKTPVLKAGDEVIHFNFPFEIDGGRGVATEGLVIFDLKESSNKHLATKGFSFKYLLGETEYNQDLPRYLKLENDMAIDVTLLHSEFDPALAKKKGGMFKSISFRSMNKD